jgi:hypothetical protein
VNTIIQPYLGKLSYAQTDPLANLVNEMAMPPMDSLSETGQFREMAERSYYLELDASRVSKHTVGQGYDFTDSLRYFQNDPISAFFVLSRADLDNPQSRGYTSRGQMVQKRNAWLTKLLKKYKEKSFYTAVSTNANFEGATYYNNATLAWSNIGLSNPMDDVYAGKLVVPEINAGIMSKKAFDYLSRNLTLSSMTTVTGAMRDGSVNPLITVEFLKNVFQLQYLWVANGQLLTSSSDETSTARSDIWGDSMLLFFHNPTPGPDEPAWMKSLYWAPLGRGKGTNGWFVTKTTEDRTGGVGSETYDIWNYYQFLVHEKSLAYRIDNLY